MLNKQIKVSANMVVHNGEKHLESAIYSLLNQTHPLFEIIVVDDGSTDSTLIKLEELKKKNPVIKIVKNYKKLGIPKSRNIAFKNSSPQSSYIAILDADDISLPHRISEQVQFLENNSDFSFVGSQIQLIDQNNEVLGHRTYPITHLEILKTLPFSNPFCQSTIMLKAKNLKEHDIYSESFPVCEDYKMWADFLEQKKAKNLDESLIQYRTKTQHQTTALNTHQVLKMILRLKTTLIFQKKYFSFRALFFYLLQGLSLALPKSFILFLRNRLYYQ